MRRKEKQSSDTRRIIHYGKDFQKTTILVDSVRCEMAAGATQISTFFRPNVSSEKGEKCGDSLIVVPFREFLLGGIFDAAGKTGEDSSEAALAVIEFVTKNYNPSQPKFGFLISALEAAVNKLGEGGTTATLLLLELAGFTYWSISIGDSPRYLHSHDEGIIPLEWETLGFVPTMLTKQNTEIGFPISFDEFNSAQCRTNFLLKHPSSSESFSNILRTALVGTGRVSVGETIILASDALTKNLMFSVDGEWVTGIDYQQDLEEMLANAEQRHPNEQLAEFIGKKIVERMHFDTKRSKKGQICQPSKDDLSIIVIERIA